MENAYEKAMAQVPQAVSRLIGFLDGVSIVVGKAASWLCLPMIFSLMYEVVMRYCFTKPTIWAQDLTVMLFGVMFMLASPYCLRDGGHVRTDFFYHHWSIRRKAVSDILHYVILFFPAHILFLEIAWAYFAKSYMQNEVSPQSSWMPIIWPVKFAIPLYVVLTMTQGVSEVLKCVYRFKTNTNLWFTCPDEATMELAAAECRDDQQGGSHVA